MGFELEIFPFSISCYFYFHRFFQCISFLIPFLYWQRTQFSLPFITDIWKARIKFQMLIGTIQVNWIIEAGGVSFFPQRYILFVYPSTRWYSLPHKHLLSLIFLATWGSPSQSGLIGIFLYFKKNNNVNSVIGVNWY